MILELVTVADSFPFGIFNVECAAFSVQEPTLIIPLSMRRAEIRKPHVNPSS